MNAYIACIGTGAMGGALMKAAAKAVGGARIGLCDVDGAKAIALSAEIGGFVFTSNASAARGCRYLVLAVKPQVLSTVLAELAPTFAELLAAGTAPVVVSIVAGATLASIRRQLIGENPAESGGTANAPGLGTKLQLVRLMPNTPALIGQGMIALSAEESVSESAVADIFAFLAQAGTVDRIDEKHLDAVTALSGSGPAYVFIFLEALADAGVRAGLSRDVALRYAVRTVRGSAALVDETGTHPAVLKDQVCSPAGTTIAAVAALEQHGFRGAVIAAVDAAFKRAKGL